MHRFTFFPSDNLNRLLILSEVRFWLFDIATYIEKGKHICIFWERPLFLLWQIEGLLSMVLCTSLAHLEGSAIIRGLLKKIKIEASEYNSYRKPSKLTDSVKASRALSQSAADAYGSRYPRGWLVCASLFQGANLLLFTPCSTTCTPFNLHCCSRSLFQSAVVLIASSWQSQLPLLPEKCCVSLNEENRQHPIDWERERDGKREDERQEKSRS